MENLTVLDIATKDVVTIHETASINAAVKLMYQHSLRSLVVISDNVFHRFGTLTATDLIKLRSNGTDFCQPLTSIKYQKAFSINEDMLLIDALDEVKQEAGYICITNQQQELTGLASYSDVISNINPQLILERRSLSDILFNHNIKQAQQDCPACEVITKMNEQMHDCVLIYHGSEPVGLITTKDVIKLFGEDLDLQAPISHYMSQPVQTIPSTSSIGAALNFIKQKNFKRLILEGVDGEIIGQITQQELISRVYSRWAEILRADNAALQEDNPEHNGPANLFEELSTIDHLTGIYNRTKFELELKKEMDRIQRYQSPPFSILFFDIDYFKAINDQHGHVIGDIILQQICLTIRKQLRSSDIFARWGGEEFVIIMPLTTLANAIIAAENIRKVINQLSIEQVGRVTCSFGVSEFKPSDSFHTVIMRADQAMYRAKANGRNRVEIGP